MRTGKNRGFTLVETAAVVGMLSLLVGVMAPALKQARASARGQSSAANLAQIGQLSGMYAVDHGGLIHTYTWRGPRPGAPQPTYILPNGVRKTALSDADAGAFQLQEILMRRTGRLEGPDAIADSRTQLPHRRMLNLVLMDYADRPFPDTLFVDPADDLLLQWQNNPLDLSTENQIPYADPKSDYTGYSTPFAWTSLGVMQRWAYSSSYTTTVPGWQPDGINTAPYFSPAIYRPSPQTPHLFLLSSNSLRILIAEGRNYAEVMFPSAKVHYFEEFDREQPGSPYFAYDHARPAKLMFDGSVNEWASGFASASADPLNPNPRWRQRYVPLHQFPVPLSGLGEQTLLSQRYRWTYRGLKGLDYPMMAPKGAVAR
jgi:Tfp pilus assembly protein PilE